MTNQKHAELIDLKEQEIEACRDALEALECELEDIWQIDIDEED